ncbi:flagellar biosynthetic protein FliO [Lutibacter sp. B2]|nr:flagellar biosynthetic protein FliO [Lutibacter sp. B2]
MISIIGAFTLVLIAAYFTAKIISQKSAVFMKGKNIKIIEKQSLGVNKLLYIVNIGSKYYIIATGKNEITMLDTIEKEELNPVIDMKNNITEKFSSYFDKKIDKENYIDKDEKND